MNVEIEMEENEKRNKKYLKEFKNWLQEKGLTSRTIGKHISNTDLFINDYLNYHEEIKTEDGVYEVIPFVTTWFVEKCAWASRNTAKDILASLKKFYQYMSENNYVSKEDYEEMCFSLKDNMDTILDEVDSFLYDDMDW